MKYLVELKCSSLGEILRKYAGVFNEDLGALKNIKASIVVKPDIPAKFCKHGLLPFTIKERVEKELKRLEKSNIISLVKHSEWAVSTAPVEKEDQALRLCGDYKVSVNQALEADTPYLVRRSF